MAFPSRAVKDGPHFGRVLFAALVVAALFALADRTALFAALVSAAFRAIAVGRPGVVAFVLAAFVAGEVFLGGPVRKHDGDAEIRTDAGFGGGPHVLDQRIVHRITDE